jgi:hypothetical protein
MDLLYALLLTLFGALTWGLIALCRHLERRAS